MSLCAYTTLQYTPDPKYSLYSHYHQIHRRPPSPTTCFTPQLVTKAHIRTTPNFSNDRLATMSRAAATPAAAACRSSLLAYARRLCSSSTSRFPTYTSADSTSVVHTTRTVDMTQTLTPISRKPFPRKDLTRNTAGPYEADGLPKPTYPKRRSPYKRTTAVINALAEEEALRLKRDGRAQLALKLPRPTAGQILRIAYVDSLHNDQHPLQYFCGIVIAVRHRLLGSTVVLRNVVDGVPIERGFAMYSPLVKNVWVVGQKKVRKRKLYFLRKRPLRESVVPGAIDKQEE